MENFTAPDWATAKQKEGMDLFARIFADYDYHFEVSFKPYELDTNHSDYFVATVTWRYGSDINNQNEQRSHDMLIGWNVQQTWNAAGEELIEWQLVFGDDEEATRTLNAENVFTDLSFAMIGITTAIIDKKNKWSVSFTPNDFYGLAHNDILNDDQREVIWGNLKKKVDWDAGLSYETIKQAIERFIQDRLEFQTDDYGIIRFDESDYQWKNDDGIQFMINWENDGTEIDPDEGLTYLARMDDENRFDPASAIQGEWKRAPFKQQCAA